MEFLFEPIVQFVGEFIIQLVLRVLVNLFVGALFNSLSRRFRPVVAIIGWAVLGALAGGISLAVVPNSAITAPLLRQINLVSSPILVGLAMMLAGKRKTRLGRTVLFVDHFAYANIFTFCATLVRFVWAA